KFKIEVKPDRPYYAPGERVQLTAQADYFFGKPVVRGEAVLVVRSGDAGQKPLAEVKGVTDDRGEVKVQFTLPRRLVGREQDEGDARVSFAVTITDSAGQSYTRAADRKVTTRPVRIHVIPEGGQLVLGVVNTLYVLVSRADGMPVAK